MSLSDDAKEFIHEIVTDTGDFAVRLDFQSPTGQTVTVNGLHSDHTNMYDENGMPIDGKKTHVSVSEQSLNDVNYETRNSDNLISLKNHKVTVHYSNGNQIKYVIDDTRPDYTINLITLFLSEYE
jgi:hypothetical protein